GHTGVQALQALEAVARCFDNYSLDLIYASPGLENERWKAILETILSLKPPHFSAYALTVEPRTRLAKAVEKGEAPAPDDETFAAQFYALLDAAEKHGYEHYETSNFALRGFRAVHNAAYWRGEAYLGLGPSAHSYDGERRRWANVARLDEYLRAVEAGVSPVAFEETLSDDEFHNEYVLTRLRTAEGIDLTEYARIFGRPLAVELLPADWAYSDQNRLRLTRAGKAFADAAALRLFV
ncbi:MAG: coproporphyrinogen III oxidase, partial [Bacteroidia bacterium]|nr:coproporphyrinogen III oxidase [Bacteroidia bacterium]